MSLLCWINHHRSHKKKLNRQARPHSSNPIHHCLFIYRSTMKTFILLVSLCTLFSAAMAFVPLVPQRMPSSLAVEREQKVETETKMDATEQIKQAFESSSPQDIDPTNTKKEEEPKRKRKKRKWVPPPHKDRIFDPLALWTAHSAKF